MINWYKVATITTEIPSTPSDNMEKNITILHELELKSMWIASSNIPNLTRKERILQRLRELAFIYFQKCREYFIKVFEQWISYHSDAIEISVDVDRSWVKETKKIFSSIDKVTEMLNSLNDRSTISEITAAVSLALNINHTSGNIFKDYGRGISYMPGKVGRKDSMPGGLSEKFMDRLSEGTGYVDLWRKEMAEEFYLKV